MKEHEGTLWGEWSALQAGRVKPEPSEEEAGWVRSL